MRPVGDEMSGKISSGLIFVTVLLLVGLATTANSQRTPTFTTDEIDLVGLTLDEVGWTRDDLGYNPAGYWERFPVVPGTLPIFDDLFRAFNIALLHRLHRSDDGMFHHRTEQEHIVSDLLYFVFESFSDHNSSKYSPYIIYSVILLPTITSDDSQLV